MREGATLHDSYEKALQSIQVSERDSQILRSMRARYLGYVGSLRTMPIWKPDSDDDDDDEKIDSDKEESDEEYNESITGWFTSKIQAPVEWTYLEEGEDRLVMGGGFATMIEFLSTGLDIRRQQSVSNIYDGKKVIVETRDKLRLACDQCVVTAPVGVLRNSHPLSKITFVPELSEEKRRCIHALGVDPGGLTHNKALLYWNPASPIWTLLDAPMFEHPDHRFHFINLHRLGRAGILMAHCWADGDYDISSLTDKQVCADILAVLRDMWPEGIVEPDSFLVTRWSEDPFSLGAYSERLSPDAESWSKIKDGWHPEWENRLHFAGEGTAGPDEGQQCTHGAFSSGVTAAARISQLRQRESVTGAVQAVDLLLEKINRVKNAKVAMKIPALV